MTTPRLVVTTAASLSPVVKYHGLAHLHRPPSCFLMRPQLNGGTLGGRRMTTAMLRTFFASGSLGPVMLGAQRTVVEAAFGPPDDFDARAPSPELAEIWKYGDVEFHFEDERVWLIHIDRFSGSDATPVAGAGLDLDPWVVVDQLSLDALVDALQRSDLQHTIVVQAHLDRILVTFPSSAQVGFSGVSREHARLDFLSLTVRNDLAQPVARP